MLSHQGAYNKCLQLILYSRYQHKLFHLVLLQHLFHHHEEVSYKIHYFILNIFCHFVAESIVWLFIVRPNDIVLPVEHQLQLPIYNAGSTNGSIYQNRELIFIIFQVHSKIELQMTPTWVTHVKSNLSYIYSNEWKTYGIIISCNRLIHFKLPVSSIVTNLHQIINKIMIFSYLCFS